MARGKIRISVPAYQALFALLAGLAASSCTIPASISAIEDELITISVLGTNDVHGTLSSQSGQGGLTVFSGYVSALRATRAADGGAVLLIDAGDMWQGTLDSNLLEGAPVVVAYNSLNYAAAAIGNHEFDFGPVGPAAIPQDDGDDPRGALKQRATEARFPLLAANLIDTSTNRPVAWQNVQPSTMVEMAGVKIGIIGVLTERALVTTLAPNTVGLRIAPLAETIISEARTLREKGAVLVIVTAHAGSSCEQFDDPLDLSSCDRSGEIMRVASALPPHLVDHIIAGHVHKGIAHIVNGIAITSSYSNARRFSRVDFMIDRATHAVKRRQIFPPHLICTFVGESNEQCASADSNPDTTTAAQYEGTSIRPLDAVVAIADRASALVDEKKSEKLGVYLKTPITLNGGPESALGNLMTDAILQSNDADVSIHNVVGGIRANLPQGDLTFGSVFRMFPFDNRVVVLELSGAALRRIITHQVPNVFARAGISGMQVFVACDSDSMNVTMRLANGHDIGDDDRIKVAVNDFLVFGGDDLLTPATPDEGFEYSTTLPMVRDVLVNWFRRQTAPMSAEQFKGPDNQRWHLPDPLPETCALQTL